MKTKVGSIIITMLLIFSLCSGCSASNKKQAKDVPITEIEAAVAAAYGEDYLPNMEYDADMIETMYGIKAEWCEEELAKAPMISFNVDTFIAIKAKDDKVEAVQQALENYRDTQINNSMQYPMNIAKVNAMEVVAYDNYVFLICLGVIPDDIEADDARLQKAEELNQIAISQIESILYE